MTTSKPEQNMSFRAAVASAGIFIVLMLLPWIKIPLFVALNRQFADSDYKVFYSLFGVATALTALGGNISRGLGAAIIAVFGWIPAIFCGICIAILAVFIVKLYTDFANSRIWGILGFTFSGLLSAMVIGGSYQFNVIFLENFQENIGQRVESFDFLVLTPLPYIILIGAVINIFVMKSLYEGYDTKRAEKYMKPAQYVTPAYGGGWTCDHCGSLNKASAAFCESCNKHK
jgi:hypothetical protein